MTSDSLEKLNTMPLPGMMLSEDEVRVLLRLLLRSGGAKAEFCRKHNIHATALSNCLAGKRAPNDRILKVMGLSPRLVYVVNGSSR